ncbi:MAG: thiamine-phosphate kinase [Acidobacteria bacterium]|nr:thiamine-phosphate kinase [Acidobacteriota bacterium]MBI3656576.1 thiamine-phosphate kinase [Acidobacteriota bacterium]
MKKQPLTEIEIIARIRRRAQSFRKEILKGIGDDSAVLKNASPSEVLLCTTDLLIEGVHFQMDFTNPVLLGEKALAVNLSDIAAMGGTPLAYFVSLAVPVARAAGFVDAFYDGLRLLERTHHVGLAGGDLSRSPQGIFISITVIGKASRRRVLYRAGARPGDRIFVTGQLGASAVGLRLLQTGQTLQTRDADIFRAILAHLHVQPRCKEGAWLATHSGATAMIDISDGLATDLHHLCRESKVGARVYIESLPVSDVALRLESDPLAAALTGGEDYELLFTASPYKAKKLLKAYPKHFSRITEIGEITSGRAVRLLDVNGRARALAATGHDHFRSNSLAHTENNNAM